MRLKSRVSPEFLQSQKEKRTATQTNPGNENSVPAIRDRVANLEHLLAVKSYTV